MKKKRFLLIFLIIAILLPACSMKPSSDDEDETSGVRTGKVTFFNESSYSVTVHKDAFSGPVLIILNSGQSKTTDVRISDNYGVGSTFPIEYKYRVVDGTDMASGEVWANGIDPNIQLNLIIEEKKSYILQIPQPSELEFPMAFIKILNASDMQCELRYLGAAFTQAGNGNISISSGKTGVYQFSSSVEGQPVDGYTVHSTFKTAEVPHFTAKNSYIYNFVYNGTNVQKTSEQKIVFN
jgi:hypothetical protein